MIRQGWIPAILPAVWVGWILSIVLLMVSCRDRSGSPEAASEPKPSEADGQGSAIIEPSDPVLVGSSGTWRFRFTVGEGGIPTGGGIVLQVSPWWRWSPPQVTKDALPGFSTVTISADDCDLQTSANEAQYYLLMQVLRGQLNQGETVAITYGDTQNGRNPGAAAEADWYVERFQEFVFKTDGDSDGVYGEIREQPGLRMKPRDAVSLWAVAPSLVSPGESFEFSVAALDPIGNLAEGFAGSLVVASTDSSLTVPSRIFMGTESRGAARFVASFATPGLARLTVHDEARGLSAASNPILCGSGKLFSNVFWGDIHGHTALSDGTGHPEDYYRYARDAARLDVAAITDHAELGFRMLRGAPWTASMNAVRDFYESDHFVTLLGYEWTNWTFGHRNVYFPGDTATVFSAIDKTSTTPEGLWEAIAPWGAMTIPHHVGGGPIAIDWDHRQPPDIEFLVEICSVHGNSEYYGCPGMIYSPREGHFVQDALRAGRRLGIIASGDGHIGHPGRWTPENPQGLVAFQADELSREAMWECLRARRVYGTSGARILLEFTINNHPMGSTIPEWEIHSKRRGQIHVMGSTDLVSVEVVKNNEIFRHFVCTGLIEKFSFVDETETHTGDYYYVRVTQGDQHQAWSSPIWLGSAG